jgi:hypothetical protein
MYSSAPYDPESQLMMLKRRRKEPANANNNTEDDFSTVGSVLGVLLCVLLFFLILFSISYPYTMRREGRPDHFEEDKWFCYHCVHSCGWRCW